MDTFFLYELYANSRTFDSVINRRTTNKELSAMIQIFTLSVNFVFMCSGKITKQSVKYPPFVSQYFLEETLQALKKVVYDIDKSSQNSVFISSYYVETSLLSDPERINHFDSSYEASLMESGSFMFSDELLMQFAKNLLFKYSPLLRNY